MATKLWAIGLVCIGTVLAGFAQVFLKLGSSHLSLNLSSLLINYYLFLGIFVYFLSFILLLISLKHGELSVLYPVFGLNYVWVILLSHYVLKEIINNQKILGIAIIIVGIAFIGAGNRT